MCPLVILGYLYVYMKLFDIITEETIRDVSLEKQKLKKSNLESNPKLSNLNFTNVQFGYNDANILLIKNFSCKIHKWVRPDFTRYSGVMLGSGCPICSKERMIKSMTKSDEELKDDLINSPNIRNLTFDNVQFKRTQDSKNNTKIKVRNYSCSKHPDWFKDEWAYYTSVRIGEIGCPTCNYKGKKGSGKTDEQWITWFKEKFPEWDYDMGPVNFGTTEDGSKKTVKNVYCTIHNHYFPEEGRGNLSVYKHDAGQGCWDCSLEREKGNKNDEKKWIDSLSRYKKLSKLYDFSKSNIIFKKPLTNGPVVTNIHCKKCKNDFSKSIKNADITTGTLYASTQGRTKCPTCIKNNNIKFWSTFQKEWLRTVKSIHLNDKGKPKFNYDRVDFNNPDTLERKYDPITGAIIQSTRRFEIGCPEHGYFIQRAIEHKKGAGCPACNESKGEEYLRNLFLSEKIKFVRGTEATFEDLKGKTKLNLQCDFVLNLKDKKVIVEYDGIQHFVPTFGSTESTRMKNYIISYRNDDIRNNFAKTNSDGISLIRIPYTMEFADIDKVLIRTLRYIKPNTVVELGDYPKRMKPKPILAKNQVDLSQRIQKPNRTGPKLSLMNTLKQIDV